MAAWMLAGLLHGQDTSDPGGYVIHTIPGNSDALLPLQLAPAWTFKEVVTEVTPAGVRFGKPVPTDALNPTGSGILEVREGVMAGLAIPATGIGGDFLELERSPVGLVSPGDLATIRPDLTLGEVLPFSPHYPLQTGASPESADTVSIWDARTQVSRVFYVQTGQGWREAGNEVVGDMAMTPIRFPSGLIVRRRAVISVEIVQFGTVIIPLEQRYHPVWPGRNIISPPFTTAPTVSFYLRPLIDAPHSILPGASAPRADTLRFTLFEGSISPVIYFGTDGWKVVGRDEDADDTEVGFVPCLDLQRAGSEGYVRFQGIFAPSAAAAADGPVAEAKPVTLSHVAGGIAITWPAQPGVTYQVQKSDPGCGAWIDFMPPVTADSTTGRLEFTPIGSRCVRVVVP